MSGASAADEEVIVFAEPPPADLKCSICLELFKDPLITACGHTFCSRCLFDIQVCACACVCARVSLPPPALGSSHH